MRLQKITTNGCDRVADRAYDFSSGKAPADLVLVTGEVGSGKTSLLELIIVAKEDAAPYAPPALRNAWVRGGEEAAKITAEWWLDEHEVAEVGSPDVRVHETVIDPASAPEAEVDRDDGLRRVLSRVQLAYPKVEYFHAGRRLPPPASAIGSESLDAERHFRLEASDHKYGSMHPWLVELALGMHEVDGLPNKEGSNAIRFDDLLRELSGTIVFAGINRGPSPTPVFERRDGTPRGLHQLSHAEQQAVILAATCVRSNLERGIALLDGPELMTSATRAADIVAVLRKHTPGCQWIVATTPEVAAKVGASRVIEMKG